MTKEQLTKTINALRNISVEFKIDYVFFEGKCLIRGFVIHNSNYIEKVKNILDNNILKKFKFKKSKEWYLGDEKEAVYMQLKCEIEMTITELEQYQINNYA
ncbi:MAG: hypothetical protein L0Y79_04740 [Chlorobi bacterium]|nr:hypothetical protein [Chlorobiota bacterium]